MKIRWFVVPFGAALCLHSSALAGDLNPPPGAVAPTMKTLDQVEPRVLIGQADVPLTIILQGSYYLTTNLIAKGVGKDCITVLADDVTLDLMGFTIGGSEVGVWERGVAIDPSAENVTVRNGTVRDCNLDGISGGASSPSASFGMRVIEVRSLRNGGNGILGGRACSIFRCTTTNNGEFGIRIGSFGLVSECVTESNAGWGVETGNACTVVNTVANLNGGNGIGVSNQSTVIGCSVSANALTGIIANSSSVSACTATFNAGNGIFALNAATITECSVSSNTGDGIRINFDCLVRSNTCDSNGLNGDGAGIRAIASHNRIEDNLVTDNDRGIDVDFTGNLIIRNSASGNTADYSIVAGNTIGQIFDFSAGGTITSIVVGGTGVWPGPWANFRF